MTTTNSIKIPEDHRDLLERPLYGHLATIRPDNTVQVNPMWFTFDGLHLRFTHTSTRQKYRNLLHNPHLAMSVADPEYPYRYLEVRGTLVRVEPDPEGTFYSELSSRYGAGGQPPADAADRIVLVVQVTSTSQQ
jgi:PPOX class probable F420-dependent enzyme